MNGKWWDASGHTTVPSPEAKAEMGRRIRAARQAQGLKTRELADLLGRESSGVSDIERGNAAFSLGSVLQVADALSVSPAALLPDSDTEGGGEFQRGFRHGYLEAINRLQEAIPEG